MIKFKVNIADIIFEINVNYESTYYYFHDFLCNEEDMADVHLCVNEKDVIEFQRSLPQFDLERCETGLLKAAMDKELVDFGAFPFHATSFSYKGNAYVFTAISGVGKSTHARGWKKNFGEDVIMINDDRPYLKVVGNDIYAYSHPQSGKDHIYNNASGKVKVIGLIVRDKQNFVVPISKSDFFPCLVQQTFKTEEPLLTAKIINLLKHVADNVSFFEIHCNMDPDSACKIHRGLSQYFEDKGAVKI